MKGKSKLICLFVMLIESIEVCNSSDVCGKYSFAGNAVSEVFYCVHNFLAISLAWKSPEESRNISVAGYSVKWKNSSDTEFGFTKRIHNNSRSSPNLISSYNLPYQYGVYLSYEDGNIKPCSSYDVEIETVYSDVTIGGTKISINTGQPSGPEIHSAECKANGTDFIEVELLPPLECYSECNFTFNIKVWAKGYSQWNAEKDWIPEFEIPDRVYLSGLLPLTEYTIYTSTNATTLQCSAVTMAEGPGPVPIMETYATSPTSIFISWSPPDRRYGDIKNYWIETVRRNDNYKKIHEVDGDFTRVILQNCSPNSEYSLVVWAENEAGIGTKSEMVIASTK